MPQLPIIAFAHRGGMAHLPENTIAAFRNAKTMGARAVETDAWVTRDGVVVLHHDGWLRIADRRIEIRDLDRADLPVEIPSIEEFYAACGTDLDVSIDIRDGRAPAKIVAAARAAGAAALDHLWLVGSLGGAAAWRRLDPRIHLVVGWGPADGDVHPRLRAMATAGVEALNVRVDHATILMAAACHHNGIRLFVWNVNDPARARRAMRLRADGVYGDDIPLLLDAIATRGRELA